jgi:hypothetical protein
MFSPSSPLAFDLFEAFPLLGMPKPLLCDLSLLILSYKMPVMQTWIMHVMAHCWWLWFPANPESDLL